MKTVLVTGAAGYIGCEFVQFLRAAGYRVVSAGRQGMDVRFDLGIPAWPKEIGQVDAVIHAAWDLTLTRWRDIERINIEGSLRFLELARNNGVQSLIFISSTSAYAAARSHYGRAKFQVECESACWGVTSVRPSLVYSRNPGGMFGALNRLVAKLPLLPLIDGGGQVLHFCHLDDLSAFVVWLIENTDLVAGATLTASSSEAATFRELLTFIANRMGKKPRFFSIPSPLIYFSLRTLEALGIVLRTKSDSLVSLLNQNPAVDLEGIKSWPGFFRPLLRT